ncbi:alpha/beta fold hydrolase [uncultured Sphingomonas sp.]|uniref:alpha/beta fold hydrolase n=1 Tax=uncultured Sphingomonas sp. TaxID=158754 RepID=UPI0035CB9207
MKRVLKGLALLVILAVALLFAWGYAPDGDAASLRAKYMNAASRFVDVGGGLAMHVRNEGKRDGPVLLHGSNSSLHTWEPWAERLGGTYRIINVDQIGHGLTGPNPAADYSSAAFVGTLDKALTRMGVARFALAGNSMGGWVAWNYALAHPDKLSALILVDASGPPDAEPTALPIGFRIARTPGINRLARVITPRGLVERSVRQSVSNQAVIDDAMIDRYHELLLYPGNRDATARRGATARNVADPDALGRLRVPTLILWGAEDKLIPVSAGRWFARTIPGSRLIVYPGIGHLSMEEAPDRSAADVAAWLRSI